MKWWEKEPVAKGIVAYENISDRERKILLSTIVLVVFLIFYMVLIEPFALQGNQYRDEYISLEESNASLEAKIEETLANKYKDPNIKYKKNLSQLEEQESEVDEKILALTQALVEPRNMVFILESALKETKGIKLISLRNLPGENVYIDSPESGSEEGTLTKVEDIESVEAKDEDYDAVIYRHALEIVVEANYKRMVEYLKRLDEMAWKVFWQELRYEVKRYPKGQLKIKIYTLSTSKEVLGV